MKYDITEQYNSVIISLKGNVMGGPDAETFRESIHNLVEEEKTDVIVDLGGVKFMNSSGLGILIGGYTTIKNADGEMVICRAEKKIESLLVVTKLITVFDHYRTLEEAIAHFDKK